MSEKPTTKTPITSGEDTNPLLQLQEAGFGNLAGMNAAWMATLNDLGTELLNFATTRIKEDVKVRHDILHCKNLVELQDVQARFMQKALQQYQQETGKLIKMSIKTMMPIEDDKAT